MIEQIDLQCADCGDAGKSVVIDSYAEPTCPACAARRLREGEDEAARTAWRDRTGRYD